MDKAANTDAVDTYSNIDVDLDSNTDVVDTYSNIDVDPDSSTDSTLDKHANTQLKSSKKQLK